MELFDKTGSAPWNSTVFGTYHWATPGQCGKDRWQGDNGHFPPVAPSPAVDFATQFHVFAVEWTASNVKWFVDDELFHERTAGNPPSLLLPSAAMYTILNTALAGDDEWPPNNITRFPQRHDIDYVRILRKAHR